MGIKFSDNALTTLASGISATETTFVLSAGTGSKYPVLPGGNGDYCVLTLEDESGNREFIHVTYRNGDGMGSGPHPCTRGHWGSLARIWPAGTPVDLRWSANAAVAVSDEAAASAVATSDAEMAGAFADHEAAPDPHPGYATNAELAGKADVSHTHSISDVTGLQGALDAKANASALGTAATKAVGTGAGDVPLLDGGGKVPVSTVPVVEDFDAVTGNGKFVLPNGMKVLFGKQASVSNGGWVTFHEAFDAHVFQVLAITIDTTINYAVVGETLLTRFAFYHGSGGMKTVSYIAIGD